MTMKEVISYWNRQPGMFVNINTGEEITVSLIEGGKRTSPSFTGSAPEWYETLVETLRMTCVKLRTLACRGARRVNVYVSHDVMCILESTLFYEPHRRGGKIDDMHIIPSSNVPNAEIRIEFKTDDVVKYGRIIIKD